MVLIMYCHIQYSNCSCTVAGSVDDSCSLSSGQCICKDNVIGLSCDTCLNGTFNLQSDNVYGCQPCFCSGISDSCRSATGYESSNITSDAELSGWSLMGDGVLTGSNDGVIIYNSSYSYLSAPPSFLGNRLSSYGRYLYINYSISSYTESIIDTPTVILMTDNIEVYGYHNDTVRVGNGVILRLQLQETIGWIVNTTGSISSAFIMQSVLHRLTGLYISTSFGNHDDVPITIHSITLESSAQGKGEESSWVEECNCNSKNYTGLSCDACANGYTRSSTGLCIECNCNGLASLCDPINGSCIDCTNNTAGPYCQYCLPGYYGNPLLSIPCLPCPCPLTSFPGQYSTNCTLSMDGNITCVDCPEGHIGNRCESCDRGYYGDPTGAMSGGSTPCTRCMCNNNIDLDVSSSCDKITGLCNNCLFNTTGDQCERCRDGYYGDATLLFPPKCHSKLLITLPSYY